MEGQKYAVWVRYPADREDLSRRELEYARREAGLKLYGILFGGKLPAVVDIEEKVSLVVDGLRPPENELRIVITVTPVRYRDVTIETGKYAELRDASARQITADIKYFVRKQIRKIFSRR